MLHKWGHGYELGQLQDGHRNVVMAQNTFISQPLCIAFRNHNPGHGNRNHVHLHNVYSRLDADTPELPRDGVRIERCHFLGGTPRGLRPSMGNIVMDLPTDGQAPALRTAAPPFGEKPLVPFDVFGRPVDALSSVGAIAR